MPKILQDDKKVLERRDDNIKSSETEAELQDQILDQLVRRLEEQDIGRKVEELQAAGEANRATWISRQEATHDTIDGFKEATADGANAGVSDFAVPLTLSVLKMYHARMHETLTLDNGVNTRAKKQASEERVPLVQDTMIHALTEWGNYNEGVEAEVDDWVWEFCSDGSAILKDSWAVEYDLYTDMESRTEVSSEESMTPDGEPIIINRPRLVETEVEKKEEVFNGPLKQRIEHEDIVFIGGKGNLNRADAVIETRYLTASELWTLADRRLFRESSVRKVIDSGGDSESLTDAAGRKAEKAKNAGKSGLDTESELERYAIREAYLKVDVTGSGINSNVVVWSHPKTKEILRATYLRRISKTGKVPYSKADFLRRPGQDYGIGLKELLHPIQTEMNAMHNIRMDAGMISTMPVFFYRPASTLDAETIRIEPGMGIPVDNPTQDVFIPNFGNRTGFALQEEAALQTMVERLVNVNDLAFGVLTGAQGATRTATGARALAAESNTNLNVFVRRLRRAWTNSLRLQFSNIQERIPDGYAFRVTGEDGEDYWREVKSRDDLKGHFDFTISANSADSNPQIAVQKAATVLQEMQDPLAIQLGVVTPGNYFEAKKDFMKALGVKNFGKYLTAPPEHVMMLSPEEELNRLLQGMEVPVTLQGDHEGFIAYADFIMNNDHLLEQYQPGQAVLIEGQKRRHQEMQQQLQQLQAQQANQQQVAINSQLGTSGVPSAQPSAALLNAGGQGEG